ncbi:MAG: helix-turn-helix transcriptional regulator [Candidatus Eremiobacteraeota bacterium]|nr:helix-turn-helix transcriptional regulator [Candidatus Eremiobacteraeota bacterium]MBC5827820.1 helix-turn-helix transcriptional regulator [Candidatus Eremiobacteraeota bacterium]
MLWWNRREGNAPAGEHLLPTGSAQLVIALHDGTFAWSAPEGASGGWSGSVVHGPQATWYRSGPKTAGVVVGASFRPEAAAALFGMPAVALTGEHLPLETLWGTEAERARQRIAAASTPPATLAELERSIARRMRRPLLMHPSTAAALRGAWDAEQPFRLRSFARECGYSQKLVIGRFCESVGLTPSRYFRIRRFAGVLGALAAELGTPAAAKARSLAQIAVESGYADHAHLDRDFRELAGVVPTSYRPIDAASPHHHILR